MKSHLWYYWFPGGLASGPVRFEKAISEVEFRTWLRNWADVTRLDRGTQVWPSSEREQTELKQNRKEMRQGVPSWSDW